MAIVDDVIEKVIPGNWTRNDHVGLLTLNSWQKEYKNIAVFMDSDNIEILWIARVENPYLYGCFQLRLEENKREFPFTHLEKLFHDTSEYNVNSIIKNNLNWRKVQRAKYGEGVSFTKDVDYAMTYSNRDNRSCRAMIVADIIIGNIFQTDQYMKYPPNGYDTTLSKNGKVYVKYRDDEFFPRYVIRYELLDESSSSNSNNSYYSSSS